jgi:hypothetical protein
VSRIYHFARSLGFGLFRLGQHWEYRSNTGSIYAQLPDRRPKHERTRHVGVSGAAVAISVIRVLQGWPIRYPERTDRRMAVGWHRCISVRGWKSTALRTKVAREQPNSVCSHSHGFGMTILGKNTLPLTCHQVVIARGTSARRRAAATERSRVNLSASHCVRSHLHYMVRSTNRRHRHARFLALEPGVSSGLSRWTGGPLADTPGGLRSSLPTGKREAGELPRWRAARRPPRSVQGRDKVERRARSFRQ